MKIWNKLKRKFIKPKPVELTEDQLKNIEHFCNFYHAAVDKYGDEAHDLIVEKLERDSK